MTPIVFPATIHKIAIDKDGEARLTLTVPASDLAPVLRSIASLKELVKVTIEAEP
jgi:hypothetical protein